MRRTFLSFLILGAIVFICNHSPTFAREVLLSEQSELALSISFDEIARRATTRHDAGNMKLNITNYGMWGAGWSLTSDYFTGERLDVGSEYPKGSDIGQVRLADCWIGGVLGSDTLVSTPWTQFQSCSEFAPSAISGMPLVKLEPGAETIGITEPRISDQDIIVKFTDSVVNSCPEQVDYLRGTPHIPLYVEVTQKTYCWSHDISDDFILFDVTIEYTGDEMIEDLYFGVVTWPSVQVDLSGETEDASDRMLPAIVGFVNRAPSPLGCGIVDDVKMMWGADFNGSPVGGEFINEAIYDPGEDWRKSATSVNGIFFLDYPTPAGSEPPTLSYNWYSECLGFDYDFGPRHREGYRDFKTGGTGAPAGDAALYHLLSNGEIDYDLLRTFHIGDTDPIWLPPPPDIALMASTSGLHVVFEVLSVGPFDVPPKAKLKIPYAFVCGENFHTDPYNASNLPWGVNQFYDNLDFSELLTHASWARWVYDNPGYDTDGDDYAGEFAVCDGDTIYYTGDGIPDWRSALPPPAPKVWLEPTVNGIRVRFNGTKSETEKDMFTGIADFEGYRIYCGRDDRAASLAVVASYDLRDYNKYVFAGSGDEYGYRVLDFPFTLDSLRCLYGFGSNPCQDTLFDPLHFTASAPYVHPDFPDSLFYFIPNDYNASALGEPGNVSRVYPNESNPSIYHPDSIPDEAYTSDGMLKYYEYEFEITGLLATVPYWINVTAFDFGNPDLDLKGLESSPTVGIQDAYPLSAMAATAEGGSRIYVYPNPYIGEADYRSQGFEGRTEEDRPDDRVRAITFANLPPKCKICIYSLDGDLVRRLDHDVDPTDPAHTHHVWNMITRNTQMVVTGLYYWVVEAEDGTTQMGKLVIIF